MIKALLSDIDGTLVQSNWINAEAWQVAFRGMGLKFDREEIRCQIGKGGDELIPFFVPGGSRHTSPIVSKPIASSSSIPTSFPTSNPSPASATSSSASKLQASASRSLRPPARKTS